MLIIAISETSAQVRTNAEQSGLARRGCDVRERGLLEDVAHVRPELEPDVAEAACGSVVLELVRPHSSHAGDRPLELADHVGDRDLLRRACELVAALGAALAGDEPRAAELREDALEEFRRN